MLTFEEYLNGINNPINEEFLEEAYSPEMKKFIPKEELSKLGNFLNKRYNISVQNASFVHWEKEFETRLLKSEEFAILVMDDDSVKVAEKQGNSLQIVYPNAYGTITAKDMKHIKAAFGLSQTYYNSTMSIKRERRWAKPKEDILVKKSRVLQKKIEYSKNKAMEDLKALCFEHIVTIISAYSDENGRWSIRAKKESPAGDISLYYSTEYSKKPRVEISVGGKLITSIDDFEVYSIAVERFYKFLKEIEKLSSSFDTLPSHP